MTPDDIIGGMDCVLFCFVLSVFIAIAIWAEVQERKKKNIVQVDWDALLEEVQKEKESEKNHE